MSEYSIDDIKLGNHYIVKAYKGDDLIFDRRHGWYIQSTVRVSSVSEDSNGAGYIYIPDKELYSNYRYEVDATMTWTQARLYSFMGGLFYDGGTYNPGLLFSTCIAGGYQTGLIGLFDLGTEWYYDTVSNIPNCMEYFSTVREIHSFQNSNYTPRQPMSGDTYRRTDGGFFIMNGRGIDGGVVPAAYARTDGFYNDNGRIYRISVYGTDGHTLLMNFIPKEKNGHIGMLDTVDNKFYPCNDDSKFIIAKG